jgi:hypothetical protein
VEPGEWRRSKQFARQVGVRFDDVRVPTESDVEDAQRLELFERLEEKMAEPGRGDAAQWLLQLMKENDWSVEEIAIAALRLLEDDAGLDIPDNSLAPPPPEFSDVNEVEVVISLGRKQKLRAGDVVGVFTNELGIPANLIGRITMATHHTFVGLPAPIAEKLLAEHPFAEFRNKRAKIVPNRK